MASSTLQGALKNGFGEAVVCDIPEPHELQSLDCCTKRFLWTHKEADRFTHSVIGAPNRRCEKSSLALGLKSQVFSKSVSRLHV